MALGGGRERQTVDMQPTLGLQLGGPEKRCAGGTISLRIEPIDLTLCTSIAIKLAHSWLKLYYIYRLYRPVAVFPGFAIKRGLGSVLIGNDS